MTGRYQQRFGYEAQLTDDNTNPLLGIPVQEILLPQLLKPAGYVCGAVGKWHLGQAMNLRPIARGFDEFFGFLTAQATPGYYNAQVLRDDTPLTETDYLTDAFTREAVAFINNHAAEPFFLYLPYNAVHGPYDQPPDIYVQRVANIPDPARRNYAAMVVALDDGIGQVLQSLRDNGILDNTVIFFLSDNGGPPVGFVSNYPLRGYKFDTLEGGIRVPFAVQWTGHIPPAVVRSSPVSSLDIVPTIAAAAGVSLPTDRAYDGVDLTPFLAGQQPLPVRALFWRWFGLGPDGPSGSENTIWAARKGSFKLVVERAKDDQPAALYNLSKDIGETRDLALTYPRKVTLLQGLYAQWTLNTMAPLWQEGSHFSTVPLNLTGDWDGFNKDDTSSPWRMTQTTAPSTNGTPDGYNLFSALVHVATSGGDTTPGTHSFVLLGRNSYGNQWGGVTTNIDQATTTPYHPDAQLGPVNTITLTGDFYYSFHVLDPIYAPALDLVLSVMKTSAPPVTVNRSQQAPEVPRPNDPITVEITTNQPKCSEEKVFLRWTTDMFITSHVIQATPSGTSYTATIPPQASGSLIQYTVLTSTVDLTSYTTSGTIDQLTLATSPSYNAVPLTPQ